MEETHPSTDVLTDCIELYMTLDATQLYDYFTDPGDTPDVYAPGYALAETEIIHTGINSLSTSTKRITCFAANSPNAAQDEFCFRQGVSSQLTNIEAWFDFNSIYEADERQGAQINTHETTTEVSLDRLETLSLMIDYTPNNLSADSHSLRARLFYGGPWDDPASQYLTVTGHTERMPTEIEEVIGFIKRVFEANPVNDIPMCCLNEETPENTDSTTLIEDT